MSDTETFPQKMNLNWPRILSVKVRTEVTVSWGGTIRTDRESVLFLRRLKSPHPYFILLLSSTKYSVFFFMFLFSFSWFKFLVFYWYTLSSHWLGSVWCRAQFCYYSVPETVTLRIVCVGCSTFSSSLFQYTSEPLWEGFRLKPLPLNLFRVSFTYFVRVVPYRPPILVLLFVPPLFDVCRTCYPRNPWSFTVSVVTLFSSFI